MSNKNQEVFDKFVSNIKREGIQDLVRWLKEDTDFFTSPASTNYHGNYEGGLLEHSINVTKFALYNYNALVKQKPEIEEQTESVIIAALFHDLCKTNCYHMEKKWVKDENNKWKDYIGYVVKDPFPLGHGEKSVYLLSKFIKLTDAEALAIRWHMSSYEPSAVIPNNAQYYAYNEAINNWLVRLIQVSDVLSIIIEKTINHKDT